MEFKTVNFRLTFYRGLMLLVLWSFFNNDSISQESNFHLGIQFNSGLISNPGADLSLLSLQAVPQFSLAGDQFRIGANAGGFYNKGFEALYGANAKIRLKEFKAADLLSLGGLYFGLGHTWSTDDSKIFSGEIYVDIAQWVGLSLEYGRDYHFDRNWISLGGTFVIWPNEKEDEF